MTDYPEAKAGGGTRRVMLRPVGSPLPMGFSGLAGASFALAGLQLSWIPVTQGQNVALVMLAFAAPLQILAAVYALLARDAATGAGMAVLAGTWAATGATMLASPPGATSGGIGLLLFVSGGALLMSVISAGTAKLAADAVLLTASLRFVLTGVYELAGGSGWRTAAGVTGVVLAVLALLAALAFASEESRGRPLLPTLRRSGPDPAGGTSPAETVGEPYTEAGVRKQL